ncbi:hypothetical protein EW146_g2356 [Bondarzewia mesenterica]|uniref:Citrate transporter-like domain-containing protein n=1 Tax=Bondarzewia mesenterica TaxID=1095465 RepID=A0A4S4M1E3_9AGAM|nr:hypothetical protein EW146_g2356 [Bondarzewia mesenterica]
MHWHLLTFRTTDITIIFPFHISIPRLLILLAHNVLVKCRILPPSTGPPRPKSIPFNFLTIPLIAVLFLLAVKAIDRTEIRRGILGTDGVKPINIMALFVSLAYISISLDATGLFRFLAFWVARKGGSSGQRLYFYLFAFFLLCGVVVGNDPVILSGTVFLVYLTRILGITPPTAWIFGQFTAANMASSVLVTSNPTNLVLAGAFSLSFITYTSSLVLPFLAAALFTYPFLAFFLFRSVELIPRSIDLPVDATDNNLGSNNPAAALIDKFGAVFGSGLLLVTLGVLVGTSTIGVPVWEVTVPPALIMLCRDLWHDWKRHIANKQSPQHAMSRPVNDADDTSVTIELQQRSLSVVEPTPRSPTPPTFSSLLSLSPLTRVFPTVHHVAQRLPVSLLPFSFLMFILVQGLASHGWVQVFAGWWRAWVNNTGPVGATFGMAVISGSLCNICGTNIGTTILLARTLQEWVSVSHPSALTRYVSIYAIALGSNYGAFTMTFSASLAGLLWRDILRQKGIQVRRTQFASLNLRIFAVATVSSATILVAQSYVIHRKM